MQLYERHQPVCGLAFEEAAKQRRDRQIHSRLMFEP